MKVRPIEITDLEAVRVLRNAERRWFFEDHEITPDEQLRWFETLDRTTTQFYVIEVCERVVGTVSVTNREDGRELGNYVLHPEFRGQGIGHAAVDAVTAEPGVYYALVKAENDTVLHHGDMFGWNRVHVRIEKIVD